MALKGTWKVSVVESTQTSEWTFNTDGTVVSRNSMIKGIPAPKSDLSGKWEIDVEASKVVVTWSIGIKDALFAPISSKFTRGEGVGRAMKLTATKIRSE